MYKICYLLHLHIYICILACYTIGALPDFVWFFLRAFSIEVIMNNTLDASITLPNVIKFTLPTICTMLFLSAYTMVDGVFVSQLVSTDALSAINIVFPMFYFIIGGGTMLGAGTSAICANLLGQGNAARAKQVFTFNVIIGFLIGVIIATISMLFTDPLVRLFGANDAIYQYCYDYLFYNAPLMPFWLVQFMFQYCFVAAGRPQLGLALTITGGVTNIVLDYIFIVQCHMGISGAALATGTGYALPAIIGITYFLRNRSCNLWFVRPTADWSAFVQSCASSVSEMVTQISNAIVILLYNGFTMYYAGNDGVAAITIVLYARFLLNALYMGYASGVAPLFSFNLGLRDFDKMRKLFALSLRFVGISSIAVFCVGVLFAGQICAVFTPWGNNVHQLATHGLRLFAISFLFTGLNVFTSSLFIACSNGRIAATIAFLRTCVFVAAGIVGLSLLFGINGVWLAVPVSEFLCLFLCVYFLYHYRTEYQYW